MTYEQSLLAIAACYTRAVAAHGGRSLARISTIVVNQGSFFTRLGNGATCTAVNIERLAGFFGEPANWPLNFIPEDAAALLAGIGRPILMAG
jgi:hypothetical protein